MSEKTLLQAYYSKMDSVVQELTSDNSLLSCAIALQLSLWPTIAIAMFYNSKVSEMQFHQSLIWLLSFIMLCLHFPAIVVSANSTISLIVKRLSKRHQTTIDDYT